MKVYIDGENFRHGIVDILGTKEVYGFPIRQLVSEVLGSEAASINYYAAKIKLPRGFQPSKQVLEKAEEIKEFNRRWVQGLLDQDVEYIKAGYLKVKTGQACPKCGHKHEVLQEKGVDVRIAVDIVDDAYHKSSKAIAIFSSDTDLIPALERAKKTGVKVTYICFSETVNRAVSAVANETVTITPKKVIQLFKEHKRGK